MSALLEKVRAAAPILRQLLGTIVMQPTLPATGKAYYTARATVSAAASMAVLASRQLSGGTKGSATFESWARLGSNQ